MSPAIMEGLAELAGDGAFPTSDARAQPHLERFGFVAGYEPEYAAVVLPDSAEMVSHVLELLHRQNAGVLFVPNEAGNGARLIRRAGPLVIVDTRRMDRILEINDQYAYALVEPGVSYTQLHAAFAERKLPFWVDSDRNPENSVAGSILSKQFGYTPYADHFLVQCGAELVLPDGQMLRTGMGAVPGSKTWQLYKYAFGPYLDGLAVQSDLAVPSKIGFWIMGAPPGFKPFMWRLPGPEAIGPAIDALQPLLLTGTIPSTVVITEAAADHQASGGAPWNLFGALYGMPEVMDLTWQVIRGALTGIGGSHEVEGSDRDADPAWQVHSRLFGGGIAPAPVQAGQAMHVTFAAPLEGAHALKLRSRAEAIARPHGLAPRAKLVLLPRSFFCRLLLPHDGTKAGRQAAATCAQDLMHGLAEDGFRLTDESFELSELGDPVAPRPGFTELAGRVRSAVSG